jgi:hypothetical protein
LEAAFVSWRGTLLALLLAGLALSFLLLSDRFRTHPATEPLLGIDPAAVDRIDIVEKGRSVTLVGKNGEWMVQGSITDRADPMLVRMLLAKASEIVPLDVLRRGDLKGAVSLQALDLKNPKRSFTVTAGKKKTLSFGIPGSVAGEIYARLGNDNEVFLISSELERLAFRPEDTFRDSRLTIFPSDRVSEMTFSKNGGMDRIALKKEPQGWCLTAPASVAADPAAAEAWMSALLRAKIDRWMPPETDPAICGLDSPTIAITVRADGVKEAVTILVGSPLPGSPDKFFVRCSDRPGICVVSTIAKALQVTAAALRTKQLKPIELDMVDKVQIDQPKGMGAGATSPRSLVMTRKSGGEEWEVRSGSSGMLSGDQMRAWHDGLMKAKAKGFEPATPEKIRLYGLETPTEIRFVARLSENTAEENAGELMLCDYFLGTATNGVVALREGNSSELMIMPESVLTPLIKTQETTPSPSPAK